MKEEDHEAIADRTADKVLDALRNDKKSFWVQPEEHYNHHKRLGGWYGTFDWGSRIVGRAIILMILGGFIALILLGSGKFKF